MSRTTSELTPSQSSGTRAEPGRSCRVSAGLSIRKHVEINPTGGEPWNVVSVRVASARKESEKRGLAACPRYMGVSGALKTARVTATATIATTATETTLHPRARDVRPTRTAQPCVHVRGVGTP